MTFELLKQMSLYFTRNNSNLIPSDLSSQGEFIVYFLPQRLYPTILSVLCLLIVLKLIYSIFTFLSQLKYSRDLQVLLFYQIDLFFFENLYYELIIYLDFLEMN